MYAARARRSLRKTIFNGTIWSSDFHVAPPADIKALFKSWTETENVSFVDQSLSGACDWTKTCAVDLQILNSSNGLTLGECPNEFKRLFWQTYNGSESFQRVDAFMFTYSTGLSELFMAFGKPLIIIASVRYEVGRLDHSRWEALNHYLYNIASDEKNTVAANNPYDVEYLKHFTGLKDIKLLPNECPYVNASYNRSRSSILVGPTRLSGPGLQLVRGDKGLQETLLHHNSTYPDLRFSMIRDLYPKFEYSDIAAHPAIVIIPYANSVMSVMEYYRIGIPIFAPSLELLVTWQTSFLLLDELSWACIHGHCHGPSLIEPHPDTPHRGTDPNKLTDPNSMRHWLNFSDFYSWPHIQYFDDWEDLFVKISSADFDGISRDMMLFTKSKSKQIRKTWMDVLRRAFQGSEVYPKSDFDSWEQASMHFYPGLRKPLLEAAC